MICRVSMVSKMDPTMLMLLMVLAEPALSIVSHSLLPFKGNAWSVCGNQEYKDSWKAVLTSRRFGLARCHATLLDDRHLLTHSSCTRVASWATFPSMGGPLALLSKPVPVTPELSLLKLAVPLDLTSSPPVPVCLLQPGGHNLVEPPLLNSAAKLTQIRECPIGKICYRLRDKDCERRSQSLRGGETLAQRAFLDRMFEEKRFFLTGVSEPNNPRRSSAGICVKTLVNVTSTIVSRLQELGVQQEDLAHLQPRSHDDERTNNKICPSSREIRLCQEKLVCDKLPPLRNRRQLRDDGDFLFWDSGETKTEEEGKTSCPVLNCKGRGLSGVTLTPAEAAAVCRSGSQGSGPHEVGTVPGVPHRKPATQRRTSAAPLPTSTTRRPEDECPPDGDCLAIAHGRCSDPDHNDCVCDRGFAFHQAQRKCLPKQERDEDKEAIEQKQDMCRTQEGDECRFPFLHNRRLTYLCVDGSLDTAHGLEPEPFKAFCPTEVNERNEPQSWGKCRLDCPLMKYHEHQELVAHLDRLSKKFRRDSKLFSLGTSRKSANLTGIRLTRDVENVDELRPRVKLIGNMHGNEPVGRELLIHFAEHLLESDARGDDPRSKRILETTDLWILPTMNPDGFGRANETLCSGGSYSSGRLNEGFQDLNRDFPDFFDYRKLQDDPDYDIYADRQKETALLMKWILSGHFVLSANFHDGAVLVNYPWDNYHDSALTNGVYKTPDHAEFYHLATTYSLSHRTMNDTVAACATWGYFKDGVTNGADWYPVHGGMQDFNYIFADTMEVTVEVSCCKFPHKSKLLGEWENNRESLYNYVGQAQRGIKGRVTDPNGNRIEGARIRVRLQGDRNWREKTVGTNNNGVYWRILVPGVYEVQAFAEETNLRSKTATVKVPDIEEPELLDLVLDDVRDERKSSAQIPPATSFSGVRRPQPRQPSPPIISFSN